MNKKVTISLCMIVKNEEQYIAKCLSSVRDVVDEMIIVDTGSTDHTVEIAKSFGASIYEYEWQSDFSKARNYGIEKASGDWIFVMDADEELKAEDKEKLRELVETTNSDYCSIQIYSYTDEHCINYSTHYTNRILRNNGRCYFKGVVHEQIPYKDDEGTELIHSYENITLYHYGYITSNVLKKDKHKRNKELLEKVMKENPDDPGLYFLYANEFVGEGATKEEQEKSIVYYEKALKNMPEYALMYFHLLYRLIIVNYSTKHYKKALFYADIAIQKAPVCTDYLYCKALILMECKQYLMAADLFQHCIKQGPGPNIVTFINGASTERAYIGLAKIYEEQEAYLIAERYYGLALRENEKNIPLLYSIARCLKGQGKTPEEIEERMSHYFENPKLLIYASFLINILFEVQCYDLAETRISELECKEEEYKKLSYLYARNYFYKRNYEEAAKNALFLFEHKEEATVFKVETSASIILLISCGILCDGATRERVVKILSEEKEEYLKVFRIFTGEEFSIDTIRNCIDIINDVLEQLIAAGEDRKIKEMLPILEQVKEEKILLRVSRIYRKYGFEEEAEELLMRFLTQTGYSDVEGLELLLIYRRSSM